MIQGWVSFDEQKWVNFDERRSRPGSFRRSNRCSKGATVKTSAKSRTTRTAHASETKAVTAGQGGQGAAKALRSREQELRDIEAALQAGVGKRFPPGALSSQAAEQLENDKRAVQKMIHNRVPDGGVEQWKKKYNHAAENRGQAVEEFRIYLDPDRISCDEARTKHLSPKDAKPVTIDIGDAELLQLADDWKFKNLPQLAGHSLRDILIECRLVIEPQIYKPGRWPVRWPRGFIHAYSADHTYSVGCLIRLLLVRAWVISSPWNKADDEQKLKLELANEWWQHCGDAMRAERERALAEANLAKERKRHSNAAKKKNEDQGKSTGDEVEKRFLRSTLPVDQRASRIAMDMKKDWKKGEPWNAIGDRRVRQIIEDRNLKKAATKAEIR
jgi:hypothetical protein